MIRAQITIPFDRTVWVVSQSKPPTWELGGIYTTKALAIAACTKPTDGVWPVVLNQDLGHETVLIVGEYPIPGDER